MPLPQPSLVIWRRGSPSRASPVLLNRLTRVTVQIWLQSSTSTTKPWGLTCSSGTSRATSTRSQVAVVLMVVAVAVVVIGPDRCVMSPSGTAVHCCNCRHALLGHSICPQHHGHRNGICTRLIPHSSFLIMCTACVCIHYLFQVSNCPFNTGNGYGDGRAIRSPPSSSPTPCLVKCGIRVSYAPTASEKC